MYNRFLLIVVFVPLAIILVALAVANRELVAFTLDPFNPGNPALTLTLPLFVFLFLALVVGLIVGSAATWIKQGRYRRLARQREQEVESLRDAAIRAPPPKVRALPKPSGVTMRAYFRQADDHGAHMLTMSAPTASMQALTFRAWSRRCARPSAPAPCSRCRHHHTIERPEGAASTLLLMPAWTDFQRRRRRPTAISASRSSPSRPTTMRSASRQ